VTRPRLAELRQSLAAPDIPHSSEPTYRKLPTGADFRLLSSLASV
jgi:hypothetical protein